MGGVSLGVPRFLASKHMKHFDTEQFHNDLKKLQKKYPSVYLEAWTPEDFALVIADIENDSFDGDCEAALIKYMDIAEDPYIANRLSRTFDANYGTNWDQLKDIIRQLMLRKDETEN